MGVQFSSASSQSIVNASPPASLTGSPLLFTIGMWIYPFTTGSGADQVAFSLTDTATISNNWQLLILATSSIWRFNRRDTASGQQPADSSTAATANAWTFLVARALAANSIRLAIRHPNGLIEHGQNTQTRNPAGIDSMQLGCLKTTSSTLFFNGVIGEFWCTDTDIQGDGAQLNNDLMLQLAYRGPFSVPHIGQSVLEYRSLRSGMDSSDDNAEDVYFGKSGRQTWTNAGATIGPHPPLPSWYRRPGNAPQTLLV